MESNGNKNKMGAQTTGLLIENNVGIIQSKEEIEEMQGILNLITENG